MRNPPVELLRLTKLDLLGQAVDLENGFALELNDWASPSNREDYPRSIAALFDKEIGSPTRFPFGFISTFGGPEGTGTTGNVMGYPEIIWGQKPWADRSTNTILPRPLESCLNTVAELSCRYDGTGKFNLAYDLWLTKKSLPADGETIEDNIIAEVMVWLDSRGGAVPSGYPRGRGKESVWYETFVAYPELGRPWYYAAYVCNPGESPFVTPLGVIIKDFLALGFVADSAKNAYLSSIELGMEVWDGTIWMCVDKLEYTL